LREEKNKTMDVKKEINQIKKVLDDHEKRISKLENYLKTKPEIKRKKISVKEFILSKRPKSDVQKTRAIAYYLEKYRGFNSFNIKDLEKGFRDAKEKIPKNLGDKIQKNISQGYMMEAEGKKNNLKAWVLTNSGEKNVENNFEKEKSI